MVLLNLQYLPKVILLYSKYKDFLKSSQPKLLYKYLNDIKKLYMQHIGLPVAYKIILFCQIWHMWL